MVESGRGDEIDPQDPAVLTQWLFDGYEDGRTGARRRARGAGPRQDELLVVVHNLEAVTASLTATSEALAAIARSLTQE